MTLKKGGNFMGMMNVLMQLRKVCNHPDLFEARSILTPFFTEPLSFRAPGCVVNALERSPLESVSVPMIHPLWSKGGGIPSVDSSLVHDTISAEQLRSLESPREVIIESVTDAQIREPQPNDKYSPGLNALLSSIWAKAKEEAISNMQVKANTNALRCQGEAFTYNNRTLNSVAVSTIFDHGKGDLPASTIAETPTRLLEMLRSQQACTDEFDSLIANFVFCVPKAGARPPVLDTMCLNTSYDQYERKLSMELSKPMRQFFRPFEKAQARLTSFFPEKKLVQFDSGKLCILAELLRELKKGGHRVLIFTQMSKMLDILEAFVNLNGLTYLRLDGSTGVDARQRLMDRFNNDPKIFCFILSTRSGGLGINLTGGMSSFIELFSASFSVFVTFLRVSTVCFTECVTLLPIILSLESRYSDILRQRLESRHGRSGSGSSS